MKKKPESSDEVYNIMREYCDKKQFDVSNASLRYWSEDCYLYFESRGWNGIKYWPAVAMRWCLTNVKKSPVKNQEVKDMPSTKLKIKGKSVRDRILEERSDA